MAATSSLASPRLLDSRVSTSPTDASEHTIESVKVDARRTDRRNGPCGRPRCRTERPVRPTREDEATERRRARGTGPKRACVLSTVTQRLWTRHVVVVMKNMQRVGVRGRAMERGDGCRLGPRILCTRGIDNLRRRTFSLMEIPKPGKIVVLWWES